MATKTCTRCGMLMDEFDTECPCEDREAIEPRASVMPEHMASVNPLFREKLQGFPEEMRPRIAQHLGGRR